MQTLEMRILLSNIEQYDSSSKLTEKYGPAYRVDVLIYQEDPLESGTIIFGMRIVGGQILLPGVSHAGKVYKHLLVGATLAKDLYTAVKTAIENEELPGVSLMSFERACRNMRVNDSVLLGSFGDHFRLVARNDQR